MNIASSMHMVLPAKHKSHCLEVGASNAECHWELTALLGPTLAKTEFNLLDVVTGCSKTW